MVGSFIDDAISSTYAADCMASIEESCANRLVVSAHAQELNHLVRGIGGWRQFSVYDVCPVLAEAELCGDLTGLVDAIARRGELQPLGEHWYEVDQDTAAWIITQTFWMDLAYRNRLMELHEATQICNEFQRRVSGERTVPSTERAFRYFTNGCTVIGPAIYTLTGDKILGWMPATQSTFDAGVIMVGRSRVGSFWAADED